MRERARALGIVLAIPLSLSLLPLRAAAQATGEPAVPPGYGTAYPSDAPQTAQPPPTFATSADPSATGAAVVVVPVTGTPYGTAVAPMAPQPPLQAREVQVEHSSSIRALWLPGLIALPVTWVSTWTASTSAFVGDAATYSWIPVIGPWLMLTQDLNGNEPAIVFSGVVQGVAAICIVLGLSLRRTWTETELVVGPATTARLSFDATGLPGGALVGARLQM